MPFPDSDRVIYQRNPLDQVICQLRFDPILRIEATAPAGFQDAIRARYPRFEEQSERLLPKDLAEKIPKEMFSALGVTGKKAYNFTSLDGTWTVSLTRDFLALSTRNYQTWEEFKEYLAIPVQALTQEYAPILLTRVGLRYQNVIRRDRLGLEHVPWSDLIQPYIAGMLSSQVEEHVTSIHETAEVTLTESCGSVRIRHGIVQENQTQEVGYLIDNDFFTTERLEVDDALDRLNSFNRRSGKLFRWCITPRLHEAMDPTTA